jgi:adenosine deaminase
MSLQTYLAALPKVELHVHLEGAMPPELLLRLAQKNNFALPAQSLEELQAHYIFQNFHDFLEVYRWVTGCLYHPDDFVDLVYTFGADMARQNIRYAEVTWTPQNYVLFGPRLPFEAVLEALNEGRARAHAQWGVEMRWIPDIVRNTPEYAEAVVGWVCEAWVKNPSCGIVALGLGGLEAGYPPELFAEVVKPAHRLGLPVNPHAGETAGAESVRGALDVLKGRRIGHGVRASEDPALVRRLAEEGVPLEVCPTSNLCLQVYPTYADHPLKHLVEAGCQVSINSDDPPLFNTTLTQEYQHAIEDCGLSLKQVEQCLLGALQAAYLDEGTKDTLLKTFMREFDHLRHEHGVADV